MPAHKLNNFQTAALLSEAGWLRSLAFSLVRDAELADDLAQQTWVQALQSPPSPDRSIRAWLRTVMKNLLRQEHRSNSRRKDRESLIATIQSEPEEQGADLLARVGMQQQLVESVMQLEEPYRTTVLLRFFEELTPTAIATRENLPISTVKTRLTRGLDRLRQRLDENHGKDRKSWALALLPVLKSPAGHAAPIPLSILPLGALFVNTKAIFAILAVLLGAGYLVTMQGTDEANETLQTNLPEVSAAQEDGGAALETPAEQLASLETTKRRELNVTEQQAASTVVVPTTEQPLVRGRVVDLQGRPISGVEIVASGRGLEDTTDASPVLGTSQADGRFEVPPPSAGSMRIRSDRYTTVMDGVATQEGSAKETVLVVAARIAIDGLVRDDLGVGIANATVRLEASRQMQANIPFILDFSDKVEFIVRTDADGRFEFAEAPVFLAGQIIATAKGYTTDKQPAPASDHGNRVFVLSRPLSEQRTVSGVVLDMRGQRVEDATVGLGVETTTSDEQGRFSFFLEDPESIQSMVAPFLGEVTADRLVAMKVGYLPAELRAPNFDEADKPLWPDHVVLRLGEEPLSIRGRVVNDAGEGLAGIRVWVTNATFLGARRIEGRSFPEFLTVESNQAGLDSRWPYVESDSQGEFELTALMDRNYNLVAMDPNTLMRVNADEVSAGRSDVKLTISYEDAWKTVRGRVVDRRGSPMADATVRVTCDAFQRKVQGRVVGTSHGSGARITTDAEGRFEFELVPKQFAYFRVDHDDAIPIEIGRSEQSLQEHVQGQPEEIVLTIERRCHFQLELANPEEADQFEMHNADGSPLTLSEFSANGRRDGPRFVIEGGRTNFVAVGDSATTLVLFLNGTEVKRMPVNLNPGEKPTLRP